MNARAEIRDLFLKAIDSLSKEYKGSSLTDIFVLVDDENAELSIFDDENNCIVKGTIRDWEISDNESLNYESDLKNVVQKMNDEGLFKVLDVYTPFSINLADEDFIVKKELLLIEDDSIIRMEDDFLKRMDKEFDDFLDKLLKN